MAAAKWQYVEGVARETFKQYHYGEIRTPMFEHYEVISRSVGDTTDIVTKEMYDFYDRATVISHFVQKEQPQLFVRMWKQALCARGSKACQAVYIGSMFRYERPQAGRLREFHQIGVECFGSANPATDVETIAMAYHLFERLGIKEVTLHLNSLGNAASRAAYRQALIDYLSPMRETLSKDSQRRLDENPLRVLDSKEKEDKIAVANAHLFLIILTRRVRLTLMLCAACLKYLLFLMLLIPIWCVGLIITTTRFLNSLQRWISLS
ncbi:ATP phosphoribosyltransferase regulatory subunit [Streptococcus equi]|uniref:ATP phosphoribosyltransferase regulatory subunit n=1 Tax=Streptococcus equi TaxID=1336 RepID=UPI001E527F63